MCQNLEKQKLLLADVLQNRCSQKFYESLWKKPTLESHFNKTARPQACSFIEKTLQHRHPPTKPPKTPIFTERLQ